MGFSLFSSRTNEAKDLMFRLNDTRPHPFAISYPQSWGFLWLSRPFWAFLRWYYAHAHIDPLVPGAVGSNKWSRVTSYKKYLIRFVWERGFFAVQISFPGWLSLCSNTLTRGQNVRHPELMSSSTQQLFRLPLLQWHHLPELKRAGVDPASIINGSMFLLRNMPAFDVLHRSVGSVDALTPDPDLVRAFSFQKAAVMLPLLGDGFVRHRQATLLRFAADLSTAIHEYSLSEVDLELLKRIIGSHVGRDSDFLHERHFPNAQVAFAVARILVAAQHGLVVRCEYGLGNRLRVLADAKALALTTGRHVIGIWGSDVHSERCWDSHP